MSDAEDDGINVRAAAFALARTLAACPACGAQTPVFALAVLAGHETRDDDDEAADTWSVAERPAFLFNVGTVADAVRLALVDRAATWRREVDAEGNDVWLNHCHRCGSVVGDTELFCEPGGFCPATPADARRIGLERLAIPLAAAAAGYAPDPAFFDAIQQG